MMPLTPEQLEFKGLETEDTRRIYAYALWALDATADWNGAEIQKTLRHLSSVMGLKLRVFLAPFFMAVAGRKSATPLFETMSILGRDISRARIRHALDTLKPMSGKEQGRWRKAYDQALADYVPEE